MTKLPKFPLGAAMLVAGSSRLTSTLAQHIQITPRTLVARLEQEDGTESQNEKNWSIWAMIAIAAVTGIALLTWGLIWYRRGNNPHRLERLKERERQEHHVRMVMEENRKKAGGDDGKEAGYLREHARSKQSILSEEGTV